MRLFFLRSFFTGVLLLPLFIFAQINVIPMPAQVVMPASADSFTITPNTTLVAEHPSVQHAARFFNDYLKQLYGFNLKKVRKPVAGNAIYLSIQGNNDTVSGSYELDISNSQISIKGNDGSGVFYGLQSLLQLLPVDKTAVLKMPFISIKDAPRYAYRGIMLDGPAFFSGRLYKKVY